MVDDIDSQERPLDFSQPQHLRKCPYCAETLSDQELQEHLLPEGNTFVCPNCRKKINIHELGRGI